MRCYELRRGGLPAGGFPEAVPHAAVVSYADEDLLDDLKFYNGQLEFVSEPGEFKVFVGPNSDAQLSKTFTLK